MKKIALILSVLIISTFNLISCNVFRGDDDMVSENIKAEMVAEILEINDTILVEIKDSEYLFGKCIIILHEDILYLSNSGSKITKSHLKVGDVIKIGYGGQVMLSYPPQVVAYTITLN